MKYLLLILSLLPFLAAAGPSDSTLVVHRLDSVFQTPVAYEFSPEVSDILSEDMFFDEMINGEQEQQIAFVRSMVAKVKETQNFIRTIDANSKFELPVGIPKAVGGLSYDVVIYAVRLQPTYAELDVVMEFEIPQNGKKLSFMGRNIKLSNAGGIVGDATLQLIGDYGINFNGDKIQLVIKGGSEVVPGTYVTIDCDGFKEMALDANVIFSRDLLIPENLNGTIQPEGRVTSSFKTVLSNWNDLIVQLSLPNFQVRGLNGFGFTVEQAVFDFSDVRNAPAVEFPQGYTSNQMLPDNTNLWRGFYMRQMSVRLPQQFKNKDNVRTSLNAYNMIIDNQGVSGLFEGKNLIPLNNGDMSGWAFSLDSIAVSLMANQIQQAGLKGKIVVPLADEQTPFRYTATMQENDQYFFNVVSTQDMQFNLWQTSKVEIYEASRIEIRVADGKFLPKAVLHGNMNIQARLSDKGEKGKGVELADISFENLEIQTVRPYIKVGNFSFGSEALQQKMAQFPISINNIGMRSLSDTETALDFDLILNLTGNDAGANSFSADAGLSLVAEMYQKDGSQRWRFKRVDVSSIEVDMTGAAYSLKGSLAFYRDDAVYGNGFNGSVEMAMTKLNFKARASAIFGNVNGDRYWYADALAEFSPGILMFPGVNAKGFGGGAYYKMKMDRSSSSPLGKTASGAFYVPDSKAGLGIKATMVLASAGTDKLFNADVTFEISFFQGGGIRYMSLLGNGNMLTPGISGGISGKLTATTAKMTQKMKEIESKVPKGVETLINTIKDDKAAIENIHGKIEGKEGITFRAFIDYDFENRVLHGNFDAFVNVAGGVIQGVGAGGRAGWAVMHFAPGEWYVYVGTPEDRIGLKVGVGPVSAQSGSYFMVGTKIPGSPPPPDAVSRILGGKNLDYMKDLNAIGNGAGVAFGSSFAFSTGDLTFLIFYAKFEADLGFDIMIKNYGDTYCSNTGRRIGINGWYANGQAYASFKGAVGIRVKVFGKRRSIEILSIGAAAILQAQLPNPIWVQGTVGGYFSVLGGLVKGNCSFQVTLGKKCEMIKKEDSVVDDLRVISQLTPGDQEKSISVFTRPQAVFNMPVNKVFEITDDNGVKRSFRMQLQSFSLTSEGRQLAGTQEWNEEKDVLAINPFDVLPPRKEVVASVEVQFEELKSGSWVKVVENGQVIFEKSVAKFSTGDAPDHIPLTNVDYSYPVVGQLNFYKGETNEGYIKLKQGQPYLFESSADWTQTGRFTDVSGNEASFGFSYASGRVSFAIPSANLKNGEVYAFELVNVPKTQAGAVDRNVSEVNTNVQTNGETLDTEIKSKRAEGTIKDLEEKAIFSSYFRSSRYSTLSEKINALNLEPTLNGLRVAWRVSFLKTNYSTQEGFDKAELTGTRFTGNKPLLKIEADLTDNQYYNSRIYPLVYEGYPIDNRITIGNRTLTTLGLPPIGAVQIVQATEGLELSQTTPVVPTMKVRSSFAYELPYYFYFDFLEIQTKVVNHYLARGIVTPRTESIIWSAFPIMLKGNYRIRVKNFVPGKAEPISARDLVFFNPIGE